MSAIITILISLFLCQAPTPTHDGHKDPNRGMEKGIVVMDIDGN